MDSRLTVAANSVLSDVTRTIQYCAALYGRARVFGSTACSGLQIVIYTHDIDFSVRLISIIKAFMF